MGFCCALICNDIALSAVAHAAFGDELAVDTGAPNGWGFSYYQAGQPLLRKHPNASPDGPLDFRQELKNVRTGLVLGHVRDSLAGGRRNENAQPFRFHNWTFCCLGNLSALDAVASQINDAIPDFVRRNIRGTTNAELLFHLLLAFLNDSGVLDKLESTPNEGATQLKSAMTYADRLLSQSSTTIDPFCCMVTNGSFVLALRRGIPLYVARKSGFSNVVQTPNGKWLSYPHLKAVAIIAGKKTAREGWEELPDRSIIGVDVDQNILDL